jgi:hypothetical protein
LRAVHEARSEEKEAKTLISLILIEKICLISIKNTRKKLKSFPRCARLLGDFY